MYNTCISIIIVELMKEQVKLDVNHNKPHEYLAHEAPQAAQAPSSEAQVLLVKRYR